jgi:glutamate-1-semialdehyde 2,1-aminomutase
LVVNRVGSMITPFFTDQESVHDDVTAKASDTKAFGRWFHGMLSRGVYWPASQFESAFLSYAHEESDVARMVQAATHAFAELAA